MTQPAMTGEEVLAVMDRFVQRAWIGSETRSRARTAVAALLAERTKAESRLKVCASTLTTAIDELRTAEAEREALRKDAERLGYVRKMAYVAVQPHYQELPKHQRTGWTIRLICGNDDSFNAAIDAAISAEGR